MLHTWKEFGSNRFSGMANVSNSLSLDVHSRNVYLLLSDRWRPKLGNHMDRLAEMMAQQNELKKAPAKTTQPKEFSLTKPKPPAVPLPELIPLLDKMKPVSDKWQLYHAENYIYRIMYDAKMQSYLFNRYQAALTEPLKRLRS